MNYRERFIRIFTTMFTTLSHFSYPLNIIALLFIILMPSYSTDIQGEIAKDTSWTEDNSPYIIKNIVTIGASARLIIEEGVEVHFDKGHGLVINGALIAMGSADKPIVFTSNAPMSTKGDWEGIYFTDSSQDELCVLKHCIVEYARIGVRCRDASPKIFDCIIRENLEYGIRCEDSSPILIHNIISENGQKRDGSGISLYGPNTAPVISYNIISSNQGAGIIARYMTAPKTVDFNTIVNNSTHGIHYIDSNQRGEISNSNIYGNRQYDIYNRQETDVNAPSNYWGLDTTLELTKVKNSFFNFTRIYDYFDQERFGKVICDNWRSEYIDTEDEYSKREQELAKSYRLHSIKQTSQRVSDNYSQRSRGYVVYVYLGGDKVLVDYNKSDNIENETTYEVQRDGVTIGKIKVTSINEKTSEASVIDAQKPLQRGDRITFKPIVILSDEAWLTSALEKSNWKSYRLPTSERRYWEPSEILKDSESRPTKAMSEFMKTSDAKIIWNHSALGRGKVYFRYNFEIGREPSESVLKVIAANPCEIYLNEQWVGNAKKNELVEFNVAAQLTSKNNVIAIMVDRNTRANTPVGLLCELVIR